MIGTNRHMTEAEMALGSVDYEPERAMEQTLVNTFMACLSHRAATAAAAAAAATSSQ
jgi:hypothetical protein